MCGMGCRIRGSRPGEGKTWGSLKLKSPGQRCTGEKAHRRQRLGAPAGKSQGGRVTRIRATSRSPVQRKQGTKAAGGGRRPSHIKPPGSGTSDGTQISNHGCQEKTGHRTRGQQLNADREWAREPRKSTGDTEDTRRAREEGGTRRRTGYAVQPPRQGSLGISSAEMKRIPYLAHRPKGNGHWPR